LRFFGVASETSFSFLGVFFLLNLSISAYSALSLAFCSLLLVVIYISAGIPSMLQLFLKVS